MAIDDFGNILRRMVRVGRVSSINPEDGTARVIFPDMDDDVSDDLPVLHTGSQTLKGYYMPDIDEQVVCLMVPNISGKGSNDGFIIGSFFNDADKPIKTGASVCRIDFGDGSFVEHDRDTGNLTIQATGDIVINGRSISLN